MASRNITKNLAGIFIAGLVVAAAPALASIRVSSNGTDSATCGGGGEAPCRTIAQAVTNAADGDAILVGPGAYSGTTINKTVSLYSASGTAGAVITGDVTLGAPGIRFGKAGKGFGVIGKVSVAGDEVSVRGNKFSLSATGVEITSGNGVVVRENDFDGGGGAVAVLGGAAAQVRGNRMTSIVNYGVFLGPLSSGAVVRENRASGVNGMGFSISGSGHLLSRNVVHGVPYGFFESGPSSDIQLEENVVFNAQAVGFNKTVGSNWILERNLVVRGNGPAMYLTGTAPLVLNDNVVIQNGAGIVIAGGSDHVLSGNSVVDGLSYGIILTDVGTGVTVSGGNLYGNITGNCGLVNSSTNVVFTNDIYWGAPTGPGLDPADLVCGNVAAVVVGSPATSLAKMSLPKIK